MFLELFYICTPQGIYCIYYWLGLYLIHILMSIWEQKFPFGGYGSDFRYGVI